MGTHYSGQGDTYRMTIQRESCCDRGGGGQEGPLSQFWEVGVKEGFQEAVMSTLRPEG